MNKHIHVNKDAGDVESGIVAFNGSIAEDLSYQEERSDLISRLEAKGYFYNWDKFDNRQLYRMATEKPARTKHKVATPIKNIKIKYCEECGARLTDGGYCPVCDGGEEHLEENMENGYIISYENLPVTRQTEKRVVGGYPGWEEWDEFEDKVDYDLKLSVEEVDEGLLGIDQIWYEPRINDDNALDYVAKNREDLFNKYQVQLKDYFRDFAIDRAQAAVDDGVLGSEPHTEYDYMEDKYMDRARGIDESFFDDDDDFDSEDTYEEVASKSVEDSDGFMTDYTWYRMSNGNNVFIFGDKDIYTPNTAEWDWEEESDEAAQEWFDSYTGFGNPDDYFNENVEEAVDRNIVWNRDNTWKLQGRRLKADAADLIMDYYVEEDGESGLYVINEHDGKYSVRNPHTRTRVTVQFDLDCSDDIHKFTIDGVEYSTRSDREAGKIIQTAVESKHRKSFDLPVDESKSINEHSSENLEIKLSKDSKMVEIPIEDHSEVGELGHPIQHGIGDPRRKREQNSKNTPVKESADKSSRGARVTLGSDYFYDLVSNIDDAGWDEITDFAYEQGWVKDGQIIIPAGTVLEFVSQDRYYDTYEVQVGQSREVFPFNRDLLIEYPLEEALTEDFKKGDSVYVKPSRKSGRVVSVKGDVVEVEIDGGKDPDRRDTFYASDLVKESPLTENMNTYSVTFYMDSLDDSVMSGPSTTKMIRASSEEEAEKKLVASSTDKYYIPTVTKVEKIDEAYVENPRELMRNKREDGAEFDEETGKWSKITYTDDGEPVDSLHPVDEAAHLNEASNKWLRAINNWIKDKEASKLVYEWYNNEDAFEDFDSVDDFIDYAKEDIYDMLDAADVEDRKIVAKALGIDIYDDDNNDTHDHSEHELSGSTYLWDGESEIPDNVATVIVADGVTEIHSNSPEWKNPTKVIIPNSVVHIGKGAFAGWRKIKTIELPDTVTTIGERAFTFCSSLKNIVIPDGVTTIGAEAFDSCHSLKSIVIPDSVTSIGKDAFNFCYELRNILIPASVTSIDGNIFEACSSALTITCSEESYAHKYAFENNISVKLIESLNEAMIYTDVDGFLGEPGGKYTLSQFRRMWQDKDNDPVMSGYDTFEEWVGETISQMDAHDDEEDYIDSTYHDYSEKELRKMGVFDNLDDPIAPSGRGKLSCATFTDKSGIMGTAGEKYTVNDLADYWEANRGSDPVLAKYKGDWKAWLDDTIEQMEVSYDSCLYEESLTESKNELDKLNTILAAQGDELRRLKKDGADQSEIDKIIKDIEDTRKKIAALCETFEHQQNKRKEDPVKESFEDMLKDPEVQRRNAEYAKRMQVILDKENELAKEAKNWPDDKILTYEEALALAKAYYAQGGDSFYETADEGYFDLLVQEFGPQTVWSMKRSFGVFDSVAKDGMKDVYYENS